MVKARGMLWLNITPECGAEMLKVGFAGEDRYSIERI
jgi:hypothetical protein